FWMVSINFLDNYVMVLMVVLTPLFTLFSRILLWYVGFLLNWVIMVLLNKTNNAFLFL
ncbi:hypothetical protein GLOIN_2v1551149, partial [Rhizophagus irregularis DAOM 181602=DAOM 197198]